MQGFIRSHPLAWFLTSGSTWTRTRTTITIIIIITMIVKLWKRCRKKLDGSLYRCTLEHLLFIGCGGVCNLSAATWSKRPIFMVFKDRKLASSILMRQAGSFAPTRERLGEREKKNSCTVVMCMSISLSIYRSIMRVKYRVDNFKKVSRFILDHSCGDLLPTTVMHTAEK